MEAFITPSYLLDSFHVEAGVTKLSQSRFFLGMNVFQRVYRNAFPPIEDYSTLPVDSPIHTQYLENRDELFS